MHRLNSKYVFIFLLATCINSGCSGPKSFTNSDSVGDDTSNISQPKSQSINILADGFEKQFMMKMEHFLDISRHIRNIFDIPKESVNITAFDEVDNSSWFTNRNAMYRMTSNEIKKGPDSVDGPDTSGEWTIIQAKAQGRTPGFTIRDSKSNRYVIKFDPPEYPELVSGAEIISTKLFYAAGYNVPENYIVHFNPRNLRLADDVGFIDENGKTRTMIDDDLEEILQRVAILPDGNIRAIASKFIKGVPLGPFKYRSVRKDDPNDLIKHQHRRELRGLRVMAAWLSHYDTKANNTFDSYVTEGGRSYVKHYLIDFGSTLGTISSGPKPNYIGHENQVDPGELFKKTLSVGLKVRDYEKFSNNQYPSIGNISSQLFQPQKYKFIFPNPAFENLTDSDALWGTKLVVSFTDEQIAAAVQTARYTDHSAAAYLVQVLKDRRDIIGNYWFNKVNPLDSFKHRNSSNNNQELLFRDLALDNGYAEKGHYRYSVHINGSSTEQNQQIIDHTAIPLPDLNQSRSGDDSTSPQNLSIAIQTRRQEFDRWSKPVHVFLRSDNSRYIIEGLSR